MRALLRAAAFIAAVGGQGCSSGFGSHSSASSYYSGGDVSEPDPPPPSPPECVSAAAWERMSALHDDTEASVHELIKCGGLQTSISRTILVIVVASNRALFTPAAYAELVRAGGGTGRNWSACFSTNGRFVQLRPTGGVQPISVTIRSSRPRAVP